MHGKKFIRSLGLFYPVGIMPVVNIGHSKTVRLPKGYRPIRQSDVNREFESDDRKMRDYRLSYFYDWSRGDNNIVLVKESVRGIIDGVIMFRFVPNIEHPKTMVVEMLARNFAAGGSSGAGYDLLRIIENYIAVQLGIERIDIEAVKDLEGYYESLGYSPTGERYYDSSWKEIVNMSKKIK